MAKYVLDLTANADEDYDYHLKTGDRSRLKKIKRLFLELEEHPQHGTGKIEQLKGNLSGKWSRRIDDRHRIIYRIEEDTRVVIVLRMKDHYE